MNFKNYFFIFALFLLLVCSVCAIAAASNDTDSSLYQSDNSSSYDENSLSSVPEGYNEIKASSNSTEGILSANATSQSTPTRENLKIDAPANFVKRGTSYYLYLKDSKGKMVPNKKLSIKLNGKSYTKTTDKNGRIAIKVSSEKSSASLNITFKGDGKYKPFSKIIKVHVLKSNLIIIGNSKLLTNGYLRIYLQGNKKTISKRTIKITIGGKTFKKKTTSEGFAVIKPKLAPKKYAVSVKFNKYTVSKRIKCVKGNVKNPLKTSIPLVNGVPDVDVMPSYYVMGYNDAKYTLLKSQYKETIKRDSYCLFLHGKLSKYTFFKTKASPKVYHILKRAKWNVIERALNIKLVKKNKYSYWPKSITASLKGKSYTYSEVRDVQNFEVSCGPTSASVCSQALKKYYSERFFQVKAHVTSGLNIPVLKSAIDSSGFKSSYYYYVDAGIKELKKGGAALIAFLPNHYVSVIDVSKDGKKVLVSNSYGKYDVGGNSRVSTGWVNLKYFKSKFAGVGLIVKLNYKLSKKNKDKVNSFYSSMGTKWVRQNTKERIPNT